MKNSNKRPHLKKKERFTIEAMIKAGIIYKNIAKGLNRGLSTIKDEVRINGGRKKYSAKKAHNKAMRKQYHKKKSCNKVAMNSNIKTFVERALARKASPETIAGHLKRHNSGDYVSAKSIRKYIKSRPHLERYLFWQRNHKKRGPKKKKVSKRLDDGRKFIELRPQLKDETGLITEYGHYEGDFIVSKHNSYVLLVIVEMMTKHTLIRLLPNRINLDVNQAIIQMLSGRLIKSFTFDNDIAMKKWSLLEEDLGAPVYFTHPYSSWEKGLVENTNRWIRQFIPKRTDLKTVTEDQIQSCIDWLNFLPRRCIDFEIPEKLMVKYEGKLLSDYQSEKVSIWG